MKSLSKILKGSRKRHTESICKTGSRQMVFVGDEIPEGKCHTVSLVLALRILGLQYGATNDQLIDAYQEKATQTEDGTFVVDKRIKDAFDVLAEFGTNHEVHPDGFAHISGCENPYVGIHIVPRLVKVPK